MMEMVDHELNRNGIIGLGRQLKRSSVGDEIRKGDYLDQKMTYDAKLHHVDHSISQSLRSAEEVQVEGIKNHHGKLRRSTEPHVKVDSNAPIRQMRRTGSLDNFAEALIKANKEKKWLNREFITMTKEQLTSKNSTKRRHSFTFSKVLRQSNYALDESHHSFIEGCSKSGIFSSASTNSSTEGSQNRRNSFTFGALFRRPSLILQDEDTDASSTDLKFRGKRLHRSSLDSLKSDLDLDHTNPKPSRRTVRRSKSYGKVPNNALSAETAFKSSMNSLNNRAVLKHYSGHQDQASRLFMQAANEIVLKSVSANFRYTMRRRRSTHTTIPDFFLMFQRKSVEDSIRNDSAEFFEGVNSLDENGTTEAMVATVLFNIAQSQRKMKKYETALEFYQNAYFARTDENLALRASIVHNTELLFRSIVGKEDAALLVNKCLGKEAWNILAEAEKEKEKKEAEEKAEKQRNMLNANNYYM
mmetsp:Transcript_3670/g.5393  ORF Transcript_3670/g.5393 Transcript_3670/m.5393 type:complete len:471 (-) Transcript_3670:291-1703(-)